MLFMILGTVTLIQLSKFSVDCLLWLHFLRLGTANSTANLLDDVEGNPCGKTFFPISQAIVSLHLWVIESIVAWVEFIAENAEILIFSAINSTNFILLFIFDYNV